MSTDTPNPAYRIPVAPGNPPTYPPTALPVNRTPAWIVLAAGAVAILASFLPWASITAPFVGTVTTYGTDGDGWITIAAAAVVVGFGIAALREDGRLVAFGIFAELASLVTIGVAVWAMVEVWRRAAALHAELTAGEDKFGIGATMADATRVRVGVGLWLLLIAGLVGAVAIVVTLLTRRSFYTSDSSGPSSVAQS